jgi:glyoxylase-like metal-dependent hydrolase (beta-lactamase superfamily II)
VTVGRKLGIAAAVLIAAVGLALIYGYGQLTSFHSVELTDSVHVIFGAGGNVGLLKTDRGPVIVDTMTFPLQGRRLKELAERIGGGPTQALINTHYHGDHTHGNPAWAVGMRVVSTGRTLSYLEHFDSDFWQGESEGTAPNETFSDSHEMRVGGKTIRSYHLGRGHTGGDLVVLFVEDRVLHAGDLFFSGRYPRIDLEAGGSAQHWVTTLDRVLALDFDQVIPGHGPVTDRAGLTRFRSFISEVAELAAEAAAAGKTLDQTLATAALTQDAGYEVMWIPFLVNFDRDSVIRSAWEEAAGVVEPVELP